MTQPLGPVSDYDYSRLRNMYMAQGIPRTMLDQLRASEQAALAEAERLKAEVAQLENEDTADYVHLRAALEEIARTPYICPHGDIAQEALNHGR